MYTFNAEKVKNDCVQWIREFFEKNGKGCSAVVGISGGKDSSIVAALCVEALGKERVIGVLMPCGEQADIDMAKLLVKTLDIRHFIINIKGAVDGVIDSMPFALSEQSRVNLPSRIRMATLYAVSQSHNGRVANTCNLSEDWVQEMKQIGRLLGLPGELVDKVPTDGLCGKTDEDNLGFTYAELDRYIREGVIENEEHRELIDHKHRMNLFKLELMPAFKPDLD